MEKKPSPEFMEFVENAARKAVEDSMSTLKGTLLELGKESGKLGLEDDALVSASVSYLVNFSAAALTEAMLIASAQALSDYFGPHAQQAHETMKKAGRPVEPVTSAFAEVAAYTIKTATVNFDKFFLGKDSPSEQEAKAAAQAKVFLDKILNKG